MEAAQQPPEPIEENFDWIDGLSLADPESARESLRAIWSCGASAESLYRLRQGLLEHFPQFDDRDFVLANLSRFVAATPSPEKLVSLLESDSGALAVLLQLLAIGPGLANRLIFDPSVFAVLRESDFAASSRTHLVEDLTRSLNEIEHANRAGLVIRKFYSREVLRIAQAEFVENLSPEKAGRRLACVADAVIESSLNYVHSRLSDRRGLPQRPDGTIPEVVVIGLGNLGGEEMSYSSPMTLVFLYDSIDNQNTWHREFYSTLVDELVSLLRGSENQSLGISVDLREGPRNEVGVHICSFREAIRIYETAGRTWQRLSFVKARVVAGSKTLGEAMLNRLTPWVYRQYVSRVELAEIGTLRHKLEKRAEQPSSSIDDIARAAGGRDDLELTVRFLQLLHGGNLTSVRCRNTHEAIVALERSGCLTHQESTLLSANHARLCRLQNLMSMMFDAGGRALPIDPVARKRLAWHLGIRAADGSGGDLERFEKLLSDTFDKNRKMINHLMLDTPSTSDEVAIETELLLDPDPDPNTVEATMLRHNLPDATRAMQDLAALSTESVPFLSPHRCRHFFSAIAPALLEEVSRTPDPHAALSSLVEVTDSLGAKATLWELLGSSRATMELMVRLCATTPYLSGILTQNPGMIDELIDSLLMNRLPSAERLDAHSIELCRGAADVELILHSFKNGAHLNIGVRDMLGKESLEAIHQAIGDTAEACVRRMIACEQESLAENYGDPVDAEGNPAELLALALGKLGGREPNYHSDLDAIFLYSAEGETRRRVGGHRATLSNHLFFNQLTQCVITRINNSGPAGRLYELDSRLRDTGEEGVWATTIEDFLDRFRSGSAPLWQRLAICKARAISGSRHLRQKLDAAVAEIICETDWQNSMAAEVREMRERMQQTAHSGNLKRGEGGTVDVEFIAQMLTLRYASQSPDIIRQGTTASLVALAEAGYLEQSQSLGLIHGYRVLRRIEANLRLMNTPARHELPEDDEQIEKLAFLMNEDDPRVILEQCQQARQGNRAIFNQVFESAAADN